MSTLTFLYNMKNSTDDNLNPQPLEIRAHTLNEAMRQIAPTLSIHCVKIVIWKSGRWFDNNKEQS